MRSIYAVLLAMLLIQQVDAGEADVVGVEVQSSGDRLFSFNVTVLHDDTGWDHYADRWDVVTVDGNVLATRILYHPHTDEQPFTRSLSAVKIAAGIDKVIVRAHDSVHKLGGKEWTVTLD